MKRVRVVLKEGKGALYGEEVDGYFDAVSFFDRYGPGKQTRTLTVSADAIETVEVVDDGRTAASVAGEPGDLFSEETDMVVAVVEPDVEKPAA